MLLRFATMHGLDDNFMVLDLVSKHLHILPSTLNSGATFTPALASTNCWWLKRRATQRQISITRSSSPTNSEARQYGSGTRRFARLVLDKRLTAGRRIRVETKSNVIELDIRSDGQIRFNMGVPHLMPADTPLQATSCAVDLDGKAVDLAAVSMGRPWPHGGGDQTCIARIRRTGPSVSEHI